MIASQLAYVALVSRDTSTLESLLGDHLGLPSVQMDTGHGDRLPVFTCGQSGIAVVPAGHAYVDGSEKTGVHHIAIGVADLTEARAHSSEVGALGRDAREGAALDGGRRIQLSARRLGDVETWLMPAFARRPASSTLVERIDHLGIASIDNRAAIAGWCTGLGQPLESQQTDIEVATAIESFTSDKYGVVYHSRPPTVIGGLRVAFVTVGDMELEFLQDYNPSAAGEVDHGLPGTTRQDKGAIARFIASRGAGLHHVAFKTRDIDHALARLAGSGVATIDHKGRPGSRRARIGFIHPKATGGVLLHFVERQETS